MAYEVLARKWRPKQFEDVVGQDHVTRTLRNAIESGRHTRCQRFMTQAMPRTSFQAPTASTNIRYCGGGRRQGGRPASQVR